MSKVQCVRSTIEDYKARGESNELDSVKSFGTLTEAERFVAGDNMESDAPSRFYAVKSGRKPGIYTDWPSAQAQITGWQKPKHRSFLTRSEAQRFLDEDDGSVLKSPTSEANLNANETTGDPSNGPIEPDSNPPLQKKPKKLANGTKARPPEIDEEDFEPGTAPLAPGTVDGFDPNIILDPSSGKIVYKTAEQRQAAKPAPSSAFDTDSIRVHTDGSALGNGTAGALAGVGVYFGPGDKRNVSTTLTGPRQTNQRAELTAIQRALDIIPRNRPAVIITDSKYAIDCVTTWFQTWRRNGWKTAAGKAVENKDLVENILARIEERLNQCGARTDFEWIKGHANNPGNVEADRLAVEGARNRAT